MAQARTPGVRFAPSPTGLFHIGNLRTALISERLARKLGRPWIVRFEDIDTARCSDKFKQKQLSDLAALGLRPDILQTQSHFKDRHFEALLLAARAGMAYPCSCSRKAVQADLLAMASAPHGARAAYSGKCRPSEKIAFDLLHESDALHAWRFRSADPSGKDDFLIGRFGTLGALAFAPSYNWACAVDDFDGHFALLVRAWDLEPAAVGQREIQKWLGSLEGRTPPSACPSIFHCSLATDAAGERLSKRTQGVTLDELLKSGRTAERIVAGLEESCFDLNSQNQNRLSEILAPLALGGEARRSVPAALL